MVSIDEFGTCDRVIIGREYSTIIGGTGDVSDKLSTLRKLADDMTGYGKARIKSKIAKLTGGDATIRIGAGSQLEMREKKKDWMMLLMLLNVH